MINLVFCYLFLLVLFFSKCFFLEGVVDSFSISGSPTAFIVNTATAGSAPINPPLDNSTTYSISTVLATTIIGSLSAPMPTGIALQVKLAAPPSSGGTSAGFVLLTTNSKTLVSSMGLISVLSSGNLITYQFTASVAASAVTSGTNTLTYTLQ